MNMLFSTSTEFLSVPAETVVYIKADGNYSTIKVAEGSEYVLTLQLGMIERRIAEMNVSEVSQFFRIGKSLIINKDFITLINPVRQKLVLSDCRSFRYELTASKESLKKLKALLEGKEEEEKEYEE